VFFAFRLMVGCGVLMLVVSLAANLQRWRGRLYHSPRLLRLLTLMSPAGFLALLAGWVVTEMGRQPWTVYGVLRTADSLSPLSLSSTLVIFIAIVLVYTLGFAAGLLYLVRQINAPLPDDADVAAEHVETPA